MEVKPGYKQTEVGIIPEEWRATTIASECDLLTGFPFPSSNFADSGVRLLRGSNVKRGMVDWKDDITQCWPSVTPPLQRYKLQEGDVAVAMDGALVGRSYAVITTSDLPALLVQRVARLRSRSTDLRLIGAWISSEKFVRHVDSVKTHTAIPHISPRDIRAFECALPAEQSEQRAIAEALSDVDGLLVGLDRLIAKKRDFNQAAMQQLLTGQTRLPGFLDDWEVKVLGNLGSTYGGLTGKTKADFGEGEARFITFMNILSNVVIDCEAFERVHVAVAESQNRAMRGDLFFNGSSETPEEVAMCAVLLEEVQDVYLNSFSFGFRFHEGADADGLFLAYYLRSREGRELMKSLAQGSTRYNLSKVALLKSTLRLPSRPEQIAIAEVLMDMDAELVALEERREKTRNLKQAMMQELLTGRTRLV